MAASRGARRWRSRQAWPESRRSSSSCLQGAKVALPDDCYQGVAGFANAGQQRERWSVRRIAVADTAAWIQACADPDLIWLESPSNPLLVVAELEQICAAPRKPGAILGVDNTFATPLNQRPLVLGADVSVQSVTKFIGGHSDLLGGVVTVRDPALLAALRQSREFGIARTSVGTSPQQKEHQSLLRPSRRPEPECMMVSHRRTLGCAVLLCAAVGCRSGGSHSVEHGQGGQPPSEYAAGMQASMIAMMHGMEAAPRTGDADKDFLSMMIAHHQGTVEMARLVLLHGRDPLVRQMAEEIIAGQQAEIESMRGRLAVLQKGRDPDPGGFPALGGTRGPAPAAQRSVNPGR